MAASPDSFPVCSPDTGRPTAGSLDTRGPLDAFAVSLGAAVDLFIAATAAEGASERTIEWYRMIIGRAVSRFGSDRPVDPISAAELRVWLLELRESLAPESIAGYVRGLKAFGNWCNAEELATAAGFRALRRPHVPQKLIAPFSTGELERLLALADPHERALTLLLLDTGLRLAEVTSLRVGTSGQKGPFGSSARDQRSGSCRSGPPPGERSSDTWPGAIPSAPPIRCSPAATARRSVGAASSTPSRGSAAARASGLAPAPTRSATPSPVATWSTAAMYSVSSRSSATRRSTWSAAMSLSQRRTSSHAIGPRRPRTA